MTGSFETVSYLADDADVLGARSLRAAALVVRDLLALAKLLETNAFDGGHVEEHIGPTRIRDETKTLVSQTLDRTFSHRSLHVAASSTRVGRGSPRARADGFPYTRVGRRGRHLNSVNRLPSIETTAETRAWSRDPALLLAG